MSILIKGMEMPKAGQILEVAESTDGIIFVREKTTLRKWYQVAVVPTYVAEIESEYKKWVGVPPINKPLAKALYEVWKKHDREDASRNG